MAVFSYCHQRLPKVLLNWWLFSKIVIKSKTAQSSAEVMAVFKDCHQRLHKVLLKWWLSLKTGEKTREKTANFQRLEKKTAEKRLLFKIFWKSVKIYSFFCLGAGIAPVDLTTLSSLRACRTLKTVVKCKFVTSPSDLFVTSCVSDAQNCGKMQILELAEQPFRHFVRVGRSKLW